MYTLTFWIGVAYIRIYAALHVMYISVSAVYGSQ